MSRICLLLWLLVTMSCKTAKSVVDQPLVFPGDWLGDWKGELEIFGATGKTMTVPMECQHRQRSDGRYDWYLIYGSGDKKDTRAYELLTIDAKKGHYQIDEKNGILIDAFVLDDRLVSTFSVMENVIQTHYIAGKDQMTFEVYMHSEKPIRISGDTILNGDTIPEVTSFHNPVFQKAVLRRVAR